MDTGHSENNSPKVPAVSVSVYLFGRIGTRRGTLEEVCNEKFSDHYSNMWHLYSTDSHEPEFNSGPHICNGLQAFRESHANIVNL